MGSISPEGEAQDLFRYVGIFCPHFLTDRFRVIGDIKAHGGLIQNKLAQADILLAENNAGMDWYRPVLAERKSPHSHIVDRGWLYDSISDGALKDPRSYLPSYLGDLSKVAYTSQPAKKTKVKTNERQLRSIYSGSEVTQIVNVLVAMSDWSNLSVIARCLSLLHDRHSEVSYRSHVQHNMDKGHHYRARAMKRREELGPDGQRESREILCNVNPEVRELMDWKASSVLISRGDKGKELVPPERPSRNVVDQGDKGRASTAVEDAGEAESSAKGSSSEEQIETTQEDDVQIMRDACVSADLIEMVDTATDSIESHEEEETQAKDRIEESYREMSPASAVLIPTGQFPKEERQKLVERLTLWLRTRFVANTSSQDSVIGTIESSQEIPRPPIELFVEIASEIPNHSTEEWKEHYESDRNQEGYLQLAKEALEKKFAIERHEAQAYEKQAVVEIRKSGEKSRTTSEEVEEQVPTQEEAVVEAEEETEMQADERIEEEEDEADEELVPNPQAYLDAQPRRLFFSSEDDQASQEEEEVDELELSDEEDGIEKDNPLGAIEGEEEDLTIRKSHAEQASTNVIADSLDSAEPQAHEQEGVEGDSDLVVEQEEESSSEEDQNIGAKISLTRKGKEKEVIGGITKRRPTPVDRRSMIPYVEICITRQSPFCSKQTKAENASQKIESRKRPRLMSISMDDDNSLLNDDDDFNSRDDDEYRMTSWNSPRNQKIMARQSSRELRIRTPTHRRQPIIVSSSSSEESSHRASTSTSLAKPADRPVVAALVAQEHLPRKVVRKTREQRLKALADEYSVPMQTVELLFNSVKGDFDQVQRLLLNVNLV